MQTNPSHDPFSITAAELKQQLDDGTDLVIVDVRNPTAFASSRIQAADTVPVYNAPFSEIMSEPGARDFVDALKAYTERRLGDEIHPDVSIVAVCASGNSSVPVTEAFRRLGYNARNLEGGMAAWNDHYDVRKMEVDANVQIFQISRPARGCLSYLVAAGDEAVVIDPLRHATVYDDAAQAHGVRIVAVLDTHGHADHISGGPELARRWDAPYYLHPYDAIHPMDVLPGTIDYTPLHDGQTVSFGSKGNEASLKAIHVPGHTLGQVALLLNESHAFVGDTIFVESIARPDLGGRGDAWAPLHYESLHRLAALPGDTVFWPGHYSRPQEADGKGLFGRTVKTLLETNSGLQQLQKGRDAFVQFILANLPEFPEQYVDMKRVNIGLIEPDERTAAALETGRNICALSEAYGK